MKSFLHTCGIVVGLVNVALFVFWLSLSRHDVVTPGVLAKGYNFDLVSFQIDVLAAVIGFTTILLAVMGFFGYQVIAERAEQRADKVAREVVSQLHKEGRLIPPGASSVAPHSLPAVNNVPVGQAQTEERA